MTGHEVAELLREALLENPMLLAESVNIPEAAAAAYTVERVDTFEEAGIMTRSAGLVLHFGRGQDGQEFQLTIVRSR